MGAPYVSANGDLRERRFRTRFRYPERAGFGALDPNARLDCMIPSRHCLPPHTSAHGFDPGWLHEA